MCATIMAALQILAIAPLSLCFASCPDAPGTCPSLSISLLQSTSHAILQESISLCRPGALVSAIGSHLQQACSKTGLFISELFAGHIIGEQAHMLPQVLPRRGMFEAEHVLSAGCMLHLVVLAHPAKPSGKQLKDHWPVTERNYYPSACYSHMLLITEDVPQILTASYPLLPNC